MRSHVFISYAREDRDAALQLRQRLIALGATPWLDVIDLVGGQDWEFAIKTALHESSHVIVLISKASVGKRGYVQKEVREALNLLETFPPGQIFVIPVRLDQSQPTHDALARLHWIDFFENADVAVEQIAKALDIDISRPPDTDTTEPVDASTTTRARQDHDLLDVLRVLRGETKFFWPELKGLPPHRDNFAAEMQTSTFNRVKVYLDYLASHGHLTYRAEHAYNTITDRSPVLNVIVENVTTQLKNLARNVATATSE